MISKVSYILRNKKYRYITIITAIIIFIIFYILTVINVYQKSILIYAEMNGLLFTIISLLSSLILSLLIGIYVSLIVYKLDLKNKLTHKHNTYAICGLTIGTAATGCPSCGIPLLALLGFPLALMSLPFKGIEIKLFGIVIIIISIYLITRKLSS